jgi:folate-binding Fe-S cluster repair protein YgfZ
MNENLLQYLWKYKIFSKIDFKDSEGNPLEVLDFGRFNKNAGQIFLLQKLKLKT